MSQPTRFDEQQILLPILQEEIEDTEADITRLGSKLEKARIEANKVRKKIEEYQAKLEEAAVYLKALLRVRELVFQRHEDSEEEGDDDETNKNNDENNEEDGEKKSDDEERENVAKSDK